MAVLTLWKSRVTLSGVWAAQGWRRLNYSGGLTAPASMPAPARIENRRWGNTHKNVRDSRVDFSLIYLCDSIVILFIWYKQAKEARHQELTNAANQAIQMAVNNGNDETVRHLHARLIQATHEVRNMLKQITGVAPITLDEAPPLKSTNEQAGSDDSGDDVPSSSLLIPNPSVGQAKNKKAIVADNSKNNSRLCVGGQGQGKKGRKSRRKTKEVAATSKSCDLLSHKLKPTF